MTKNSTLLVIIEGTEGKNECINVDDLLDPNGKVSTELKETFRNIEYSPSEKVLKKILMNI